MYVDYKLIGAKIKARRRELKITQEVLAEKLSVSIGYISQVERGVTRISLDLLAQISGILNSDIAYFVSGTAISESGYLKNEMAEKFNQLSAAQKKIVIGIIDVIIKESV